MTSRAYKREREREVWRRQRKEIGGTCHNDKPGLLYEKGVLDDKFMKREKGVQTTSDRTIKGKSCPVATLRCAPEPDPGEY